MRAYAIFGFVFLALVSGSLAADLTLGTSTTFQLNVNSTSASYSLIPNITVSGIESVLFVIASNESVSVTAGSKVYDNVTLVQFRVDYCGWNGLNITITLLNASLTAACSINASTEAIQVHPSAVYSTVNSSGPSRFTIITFNTTSAELPLSVNLTTNATAADQTVIYLANNAYAGAKCSNLNCSGNCAVLINTNGTWNALISSSASAVWAVVLGVAPPNNTNTTTTTTTGGNTTTTTTTGGNTTTTTGGNTTTTSTTGGNGTTSTTTGMATTTTMSSTTMSSTTMSSTTTTTTGDSGGGGGGDGWKVAVGILVPLGVIGIAGGVGLWYYKKRHGRGFQTV